MISTKKLRGGSHNSKRWALIITCLSTRAVHFEVLEEMSADSTINALRRFHAIRGFSRSILTDLGTNFVGARRELQELACKSATVNYLNSIHCDWKFNTVQASHYGGVYERKIGSARRILEGMFSKLGPRQLTHETLVTMLAEVSAIMNSTPITAISDNPGDPIPLSPSLLLTQKLNANRDISISDNPNFSDITILSKKRWKQVQYLAQQFWSRWRHEYLQSLQARCKWQSDAPKFMVNDLVLIKDKTSPRNEWSMAIVEKVSESGRRATVRYNGQSKEHISTNLVFLLRPSV